MKKWLFKSCFFALLAVSFPCRQSQALEDKVFSTGYCEVHYSDDKALGNFLWRITGRRFTFTDDTALARTRIDALIERTQQVLDMYPDKLRVRIELYPAYSEGNIAKYDHKRRTIVVYADKVTDGVFAHEAAHAIICNYFSPPPPEKMQEIIAQYVDRNLWNDY